MCNNPQEICRLIINILNGIFWDEGISSLILSSCKPIRGHWLANIMFQSAYPGVSIIYHLVHQKASIWYEVPIKLSGDISYRYYVPVSLSEGTNYYILNSCELIQMHQPNASAIIPASLSEGNSYLLSGYPEASGIQYWIFVRLSEAIRHLILSSLQAIRGQQASNIEFLSGYPKASGI